MVFERAAALTFECEGKFRTNFEVVRSNLCRRKAAAASKGVEKGTRRGTGGADNGWCEAATSGQWCGEKNDDYGGSYYT